LVGILIGVRRRRRRRRRRPTRDANMSKVVWKVLKSLGIVARCPNCASAWTGGHPNPEDIEHCIVCDNHNGIMTGWVWGPVIDPFCWFGQHNVSRNLDRYLKEHNDNHDSEA